MKNKKGTGGLFYKDNNQQYWFLGAFSNNFEDAEGEIISWDAHTENANWLKSNNIKPPVTVFHLPQFPPLFHMVHVLSVLSGDISPQEYTKNLKDLYAPVAIGETEAVIPLNGFIFVVAKVYDDKKELVERLSARNQTWGMSHGFIKLRASGNMIEKYRSFEYSVLPEEWAANKATPIGLIKRGDFSMDNVMKQLSAEDRELLNDLLDGSVEDLESATSKARDILSAVLRSKSLSPDEPEKEEEKQEEDKQEDEQSVADEETPTPDEQAEQAFENEGAPPPLPEEGTKMYADFRQKMMEDLKVEELVQALKSAGEAITSLQAEVDKLNRQVEAIKADEDTKIAASFIAPDWTLGLGRKTSHTVADEDTLLDELKDNIPDKVTEQPNEADTDNPLYRGFYRLFS